MILRYTLNNDTEGQEITTYSPKGWRETELVLARHAKYEGIFLDYTVKVDFFCGAGKEYIDTIYDTQGIEAVVSILIEIDCNETGDYEVLYNGQLIMKTYDRIRSAPEYTRVNLEQIGIIQTVLNRLETKINLTATETLDGTAVSPLAYAPYDLTTHSKMIIEEGRGNFAGLEDEWLLEGSDFDDLEMSSTGDGDYRETDHSFSQTAIPENTIINELPGYTYDVNSLARSDVYPSDNTQIQGESLYVNLFAGSYNVSAKLKFAVQLNVAGSGASPSLDYSFESFLTPHLYLQAGSTIYLIESKPELHSTATFNPTVNTIVVPFTEYTFEFDQAVTLTDNDVIRVYIKFDSRRIIQRPEAGDNYTLNITQNSYFNTDFDEGTKAFIDVQFESVEEDTTTKAFAIFETGADIARKITDQADSFRSNYLGRTNSEPYAYSGNGCGSFSAFTNGFQLRGFPLVDKPMYMSMREYFDGLNAIHCLGLGVKQEGANTLIEIEPKEYFYRNNEVVLTLNNIRGLATKLDQRYFYSRFKIGFKDWRKEGVNGLDEFCTTHEYATLLKSVNTELAAQSELIAGPYAIEKERRVRYADSGTTDEDYDNNNFIIALNRTTVDDIPTMLDVAEKDENFTDVENVFSPETIYNLRFSPARSARNWYKILATSLIKLNTSLKNVKFSFAEGNKSMTSKGTEECDPANEGTVSEGGDLVLTVPNSNSAFDPLFTGEIDTLEEYPLSLASYLFLKDLDDEGIPNYYKMVRYSTEEADYLFGFIDEIRYKPITGMASFRFRRAYIRDIDCTHIYVEAGYVECGYVE